MINKFFYHNDSVWTYKRYSLEVLLLRKYFSLSLKKDKYHSFLAWGNWNGIRGYEDIIRFRKLHKIARHKTK